MGRGRAKAKQQRVARELKYNTHATDLDALQRELGAGDHFGVAPNQRSDDGDAASSGLDDVEDDGAEGDDYDDDWAGARR